MPHKLWHTTAMGVIKAWAPLPACTDLLLRAPAINTQCGNHQHGLAVDLCQCSMRDVTCSEDQGVAAKQCQTHVYMHRPCQAVFATSTRLLSGACAGISCLCVQHFRWLPGIQGQSFVLRGHPQTESVQCILPPRVHAVPVSAALLAQGSAAAGPEIKAAKSQMGFVCAAALWLGVIIVTGTAQPAGVSGTAQPVPQHS